MYFDNKDQRSPLKNGTSVVLSAPEKNICIEYIIDSLAGSGGFALMHIAHEKKQSAALHRAKGTVSAYTGQCRR